jgi:hypothetical protein
MGAIGEFITAWLLFMLIAGLFSLTKGWPFQGAPYVTFGLAIACTVLRPR